MSARALASVAARLKARLPEPESADLELRLLLGEADDLTPQTLLMEPERVLAAHTEKQLIALVERRRRGEPLAYILGETGFMNLHLKVTPAVLIPRPETESLVLQLLALPIAADAPRMLDLGTGSGAIALAVAEARPKWHIVASDISASALSIAKENAHRHNQGERLVFHCGDWLDDQPKAYFDLIAANPPYIAEDDLCLTRGALTFEPAGALTSGPDGLDHLRTIIASAPAHLRPSGWLILEHGHNQDEACRTLLDAAGFTGVQTHPDLAGHPRVSLGRLAKET